MAKQPKPKACRSWIVRLRRTVEVDVTCEDCTREEALDDYTEHAVSEEKLDTVLEEHVLNVRPSE